MSNPGQFLDGEMAIVSGAVRVPGVTVAPKIVTVHLPGPFPKPAANWRRSIGQLSERFRDYARDPQLSAVIVAGDLNATNDMREFREPLQDGYRDAAEQTGAGIQFTLPSYSAVPPIIAIDHILTLRSTATSVQTARVPVSDHLALIADVVIPPAQLVLREGSVAHGRGR